MIDGSQETLIQQGLQKDHLPRDQQQSTLYAVYGRESSASGQLSSSSSSGPQLYQISGEHGGGLADFAAHHTYETQAASVPGSDLGSSQLGSYALGSMPPMRTADSRQPCGEKPQVREVDAVMAMMNSIRRKPVAPVAPAPPPTTAEQDVARQLQTHQLSRTVSPLRWRIMVVMIALFVFINGYDISNTANIQASIYKDFGHIEIFSWITLGYCVAIASFMPLVRRLAEIFDFRPFMVVSAILFMVGAATTGSASSLGAVIVGRVINGVGAAGLTYLVVGYVAFFSQPDEVARVQGMIGMMLSVGLIAGPLIGTGFASNDNATWRWAYYLVLPIMGITLIPIWLVFPSYTAPRPPGVTFSQQLLHVDWVGAVLHVTTITVLSLALTLSGSKYSWNSGSAIALWVVAGLCLVSYVVQQKFSILTTPQQRIFPGHLLKNHTILAGNLGSFCAATAYSVGLYYLPIYFAFVQGHSPVGSAVHFLPFIGVFIAGSIISGGLLPIIGRYKVLYLVGGPVILASGALLATQMRPDVSESVVMGLEALLGFGVGMSFSYSMPISTAVLPPSELFAAVCLSNLSTLGTISIALSIAGSVFQNVGHRLLHDAIGSYGFSEQAIMEALGGVASPIWEESNPTVQKLAVDAVCWTINTEFWIVLGAGTICTIAALFMSERQL